MKSSIFMEGVICRLQVAGQIIIIIIVTMIIIIIILVRLSDQETPCAHCDK